MYCVHLASSLARPMVRPSVGLLLLVRCLSTFAACDNVTPSTGQTVTCDSSAPNPDTTGIAATPGSTHVTVNILPGAELDVGNSNVVFVLDQSTVTNQGTLRQTADFFDAISSQGTGAGHNVLINAGTITTTGTQSEAMFNSAAAVTMINQASGVMQTSGTNSNAMNDFQGPGGSLLVNDGHILTLGTGSYGMVAASPNDMVINNGLIESNGFAGAGLYSTGDITGNVPYGTGTATLVNNGTIDVPGTGGAGMVALNIDPVIAANYGVLSVTGQQSAGAFFNGPVTFVNGGGARIEVPQSDGVIANGGGSIRNAGAVTAFGVGIFVGGPATIANSGSIVSSGYIAIQAQGNGKVTINNSGVLSGPVAAVQTDAGNDEFTMSAGSTSGVVNLGGGSNTITLTGGVIGSGISTISGPSDVLMWTSGGTIVGNVTLAGANNVATLTGLTDANLSGLTGLASATGTGTLTLDGTEVSGASRFSNWTMINVSNASALTLDARGLTLGNAGVGTGTLNIDATSTLFSGGFGDPSISPAVAGQRVTVNNAGTIDLTNGGTSTTDALVINGNYVGQNGRLLLQTVLGADGAASDKLVVSQGTGSGSTTLGVTNLDGRGALTQHDGILVVQAINGASTTGGAFSLPGRLAAGAYVYDLFKGGVSANTTDNWYLRSSVAPMQIPEPASESGNSMPLAAPVAAAGTPPLPPAPPAGSAPIPLYRMEVPVYAGVPGLARAMMVDTLDTFHDRHGDQTLLDEQGVLPAAWVRAWGEHTSFATGGAASPDFSGTIGGVQVGHDVFADTSANGHRDHVGAFLGVARAYGDASGFALGFPGYAAGNLSIDSYSLGAYWTHIGPGGWYTDTVLMGSTMTIDPMSHEGVGAGTHGHAQAVSIEGGLPVGITLPILNGIVVEPQAQVIWQHESINGLDDGISTVAFHADSGVIGRIGIRFSGSLETMGAVWLPYLRMNLWRTFGGTDSVTYANNTVLTTSVASTAAECELGIAARVTLHGSVYATFGYTTNVNGPHRETVQGNAGLRWSW